MVQESKALQKLQIFSFYNAIDRIIMDIVREKVQFLTVQDSFSEV